MFPVRKNAAANSSYTKTISNMATETITTGLKKYAIGSKLRRFAFEKHGFTRVEQAYRAITGAPFKAERT